MELDSGTTDALTSASADSAGILHADLWSLMGLGCGLLFAYLLARVVMPRA